jgi:iron(III) transport system substrate-binding protein
VRGGRLPAATVAAYSNKTDNREKEFDMRKTLLATISALALPLVLATGAAAADLPKATQKALSKLKLDTSILNGLDKELTVPQAWVDGAAKEDGVIILGTWNEREFNAMTAPFKERYPKVKLRYNRAGTAARGTKVLVALGEGRVIADVLTSIADATFEFIKMKALADLRELPVYNSIPEDFAASDGTWLSFKTSFRCLAYNTDKVKKEDLPATWDDLVRNPRWRGGALGISNHPDSWLLGLWGKKGEEWGRDFTRRLFEDVQPQRRKEGMTAMTALTAGGEFAANLPAPEWVAQKYKVKGAPIGYHCPSPVPVNTSQIVMLEKSPHKNGARLFINWILSREGQILQYADTFAVPAHKGLQSPQFLPFSETITGKPHIVRDDELLVSDTNKKMQELWERYWTASGDGK